MKSKAMWISCVLAALFSGRVANANAIITIGQIGPDVEVTGSGTINLTDLTFSYDGGALPSLGPSGGVVVVGGNGIGNFVVVYSGASGPVSYGSGPCCVFADFADGSMFGVSGSQIFVPAGYVSGTGLFGDALFLNTTFAALGVKLGTSYTWTWGSGANADSLTLDIAPEPSTLSLLGIGIAALAGITYRHRKSGRVLREAKTPISPISSWC